MISHYFCIDQKTSLSLNKKGIKSVSLKVIYIYSYIAAGGSYAGNYPFVKDYIGISGKYGVF